MRLPIDGLPGWHRVALDSVGSTNAEALSWFEAGDPGRLWVTADEQTSGKGRRGRDWHSPRGNLHASVLLVNPAVPENVSTLPLVAAVALHNAVVNVAAELEPLLHIKWPNDLLLNGGKAAGMLLEMAKRNDGAQAVVIGFGVNCAQTPDQAQYRTASLGDMAKHLSAERLFYALSLSLQESMDVWAGGDGFATIREQWLDRAAGIGGPIVARFTDHDVAGIFRDLDIEGRLLLELEDGTIQRISAADIFLGNSDPQRA